MTCPFIFSFGMAAPLEVLDENIDEHRISELIR
jgi:hypothetical protein